MRDIVQSMGYCICRVVHYVVWLAQASCIAYTGTYASTIHRLPK